MNCCLFPVTARPPCSRAPSTRDGRQAWGAMQAHHELGKGEEPEARGAARHPPSYIVLLSRASAWQRLMGQSLCIWQPLAGMTLVTGPNVIA